jgi:hypothetical protein
VLFGLGVFHPAPATFTMTGSIQINGSPGEDFLADETGTCSGTGGYSDMNAGTAVTVADGTGRVVATGSLGSGASDS